MQGRSLTRVDDRAYTSFCELVGPVVYGLDRRTCVEEVDTLELALVELRQSFAEVFEQGHVPAEPKLDRLLNLGACFLKF